MKTLKTLSEINTISMFSEVQWGSKRLQFYLKHTSNTLCVGGLHLQLTFWKAITCWQRKQQGDMAMLRVQSLAKKNRCDSPCELQSLYLWKRWRLVDGLQTETLECSLLQFRALLYHSKNTITLFQYTYRHALPPSLLSHNTQKRGENQSPHKKSRWEYIIWSEKQFAMAISCLCTKVISQSSGISAGSSYWVGVGHYTTWLQNLHRPLQRQGSLSEWNPEWCTHCVLIETGW